MPDLCKLIDQGFLFRFRHCLDLQVERRPWRRGEGLASGYASEAVKGQVCGTLAADAYRLGAVAACADSSKQLVQPNDGASQAAAVQAQALGVRSPALVWRALKEDLQAHAVIVQRLVRKLYVGQLVFDIAHVVISSVLVG